MSSRYRQFEHLLHLASRQCDGTIGADELQELERLVAASPPARQAYLDYVFLHADLAWTDAALEGSLAEPSAEEPCGEARLAPCPPTSTATPSRQSASTWLGQVVVACLVLAIGVGWWSLNAPLMSRRPLLAETVAQLVEAESVEWVDRRGTIRVGAKLGLGTLRVHRGTARIRFRNGTIIDLGEEAALRIESAMSVRLIHGSASADVPPEAIGFRIETPAASVIDLGTRFTAHVGDSGQTEVRVLEGKVELQERRRLPRYYLSFDNTSGPAVDHFGGLRGKIIAGARRVPGLIGRGAVHFDNSKTSEVNLGNGFNSSTTPSGFVTTTGITVEALIRPDWTGAGRTTGERFDYDEIFRVEDGEYRILLSFQNDDHEIPTRPPIAKGPSLAFGLHLDGHGYSELEIPLDGKEGRPTLADLKDGSAHHVVATYDSREGVKRLYIDGVVRQEYRVEPGTLIISGGKANAVIGNNEKRVNEAFQGVIDEFAFYDFALSPEEVARHHESVASGTNYFGRPLEELIAEARQHRRQQLTTGNSAVWEEPRP
ncbi:FecR protein [Planctomycetes bacterium Pan216]|uniref:FecR protein n=1 Tax=Kolteria novifilia TaxID=2527975 RepID=A0A518BBE7_9BACT|nr:FecR protein [Planctomycetes bacterium Pan216]